MEETLQLVPIKFDKMLQSKAYTCIILSTDEKRFAIYTAPQSGKVIQNYLTSTTKVRPYTHDLIEGLFRGLDITPKHIVINDLVDTTYFARLFVEQKNGDMVHIVEIDARPSDCITLALIYKVPIYTTVQVLETAIAYEE